MRVFCCLTLCQGAALSCIRGRASRNERAGALPNCRAIMPTGSLGMFCNQRLANCLHACYLRSNFTTEYRRRPTSNSPRNPDWLQIRSIFLAAFCAGCVRQLIRTGMIRTSRTHGTADIAPTSNICRILICRKQQAIVNGNWGMPMPVRFPPGNQGAGCPLR